MTIKLESRTMSRKTQVNWLVNHILPAGTLVAHYRIDALLDSGGMGDLYKAFDGVLGRFVALKVLPQDVVESREDEWMKSFEWSRDGSKLIAARLSEASDVILVRDTAVQ